MKKTAKKQARVSGGSASNFRKISASTGKRPMTAAVRVKSPAPYGQTGTYNAMVHSGSSHERDFMARNSNYRDTYGGMEARSG